MKHKYAIAVVKDGNVTGHIGPFDDPAVVEIVLTYWLVKVAVFRDHQCTFRPTEVSNAAVMIPLCDVWDAIVPNPRNDYLANLKAAMKLLGL
jgi:hypothetical protein